jgi:hypothetical protein
MTNKIFPELAGINKLNFLEAAGGGLPPGIAEGSIKPAAPTLVETQPVTNPEITLAADFLKAKGPTSNALRQEIAIGRDLEGTRGAMQLLQGMDNVSNKHGHLLGLELRAVGDRLRQADMKGVPGNIVKTAVASGIVFLAFHTVTEGASTIDAVQKLATGASDLTKGIQNSTSAFSIDFTNINQGGQEINQVINQLTQHGIQTAEYATGTVTALLVKPVDRVRDLSHGLGRALNTAGTAVGKALGTERAITPTAPKLEVVGK